MLNPQFLTRLEQLRIYCQQPFRGKFRGDRRSLNRGTGVEFTDYRIYEPGDDLRYLDWNVYARLEKPFIKLFQADEELAVSILIDTSQSMAFGEPSKLVYVKQIASALGYIALANSDRVSLYSLADRLSSVLPPTYGKSQYTRLEKALSPIESGGTTRLTDCLKHLAVYQPKAGVVIILSDFLDSEGYTEGINSLLGRGYVLTVIQIQTLEEIELPPPGDWQLEDSETGETKEITINEETIEHFRSQQNIFNDTLHRYCSERGISYVRLSTDMSIESAIMQDFQRVGFIQRKH